MLNFYEFFSIDAFRKNRDNETSCNLLPLWVMVMTSVSLLLMAINSSINFFIYCLVMTLPESKYRVCQGLWPSLMFGDEDIEPQNFWASTKSHVATTNLCIHLCSNYIGWPDQGKYEIEKHFAKQVVAT
jgi:hypothetical protein